MHDGATGLRTPLWARDGKPTSTACPEAAAASEVAAQARHSTSISPAAHLPLEPPGAQ